MQPNSEKTEKETMLLPRCLCEIELPHTAEHACQLPRQIMPTLKLQDTSTSLMNEKKRRVEELMTNLKAVRAEDIELKDKFEERTQKLIEELRNLPGENDTSDKWLMGDVMVESGNRLKYQLDHSRFQLADVRNQLHSLKKDLNMYRKIVRQEVGSDMTFHQLLTSKQWKGRAEQIQCLKLEIADMEAKAYGHKYFRNPLCIPEYKPRFPRVEDLIPRRQVEYLKNEAIKRKEKKYQQETEVTSFMHEYGDIALMYKASLTHNKALAEELRSLKEQQEIYEEKSKEDLGLIKKLVAHQMHMREMLDRGAHLTQLVDHKQKGKCSSDKKEKEMDAIKYKALWEASEYQKQSFLEMLQALASRLENVMEKTEEAEKHCQENKYRHKELEKMIEKKKTQAKPVKKKKKGGKDESEGKDMSVAGQLEAVTEENEFLKSFLHSEIESKEKDLELYKLTMDNIRQQYLEALEKLKKKKEDSSLSPKPSSES